MSPAPETCEFDIVYNKWNIKPATTALATITAPLANTWLLCCIDKWSEKEYGDKELWQVF